MSVRRAVIEHLQVRIPAFGGRVYQAFLAPVNAPTPFATVKLAGLRGAIELADAGDQQIEVRIYRKQDDFVALDIIRHAVITALNDQVISVEQYRIRWVPTGPLDFVDDEKKLLGCMMTFEVPVIYQRG